MELSLSLESNRSARVGIPGRQVVGSLRLPVTRQIIQPIGLSDNVAVGAVYRSTRNSQRQRGSPYIYTIYVHTVGWEEADKAGRVLV